MRVAAGVALLLAAGAAAQEARRSGLEYMSPALQAIQRDATQNPALLWVGEGEALWTRRAPNGRRCVDCHAEPPATAAAIHPKFNAALGRPLTLAGRIDQCRQQHLALSPQGADGAEVLALAVLLAERAKGRPISPPADPRLTSWRERGATLWRTRFGQLNLACTQCHDDRPGQRLGGAAIPQAHPTGYPTYRLEWQGLGSLERRLRGCLVGVRAEPFTPGADEWVAIEAFLMQRAAAMPLEGPAVRP